MPKIQYERKRIGADKLALIEKANEIIDEYTAQGFDLTLRQLYYQFVSRDIIKNNLKEYGRLGDAVSDGRRAGLIDWNAIVDRTRNLKSYSTWKSPASIVSACASQFAMDLWADQSNRVEVWVEKEALVGIVDVACEPYQVPYFACRGYVSDSEMWGAAQRMRDYKLQGVHKDSKAQRLHIIHLGDHDPSGIDMTRDIEDRLTLFGDGVMPRVHRVALNMSQVEEHRPPPNPAKTTDARFGEYQKAYGDESWELDALDPTTLTNIIRENILGFLDIGKFRDAERRQSAGRAKLREIADSMIE